MLSIRRVMALGLALAVVLAVSAPLGAVQEKDEALKKKYAAYIGEYEFEFEGQYMVLRFWVEDGAFWGAPEGEQPAELNAVEGVDHKFDVDVMGQYYEIQFVPDESGKVTKCLVAVQGMEMEGVKIEK